MNYFLAAVYLVSALLSYRLRRSLYEAMAWDRSPYKRPYDLVGGRARDTLRMLVLSLIPLYNTISVIEMYSRKDEYQKMIEDADQWRANRGID